MNKLSFVIPCYRSEKTLPSVINEIILCVTKLKKYSYEIILVNDNSPDNTFSVIQELCKGNRNIKSLDLSRNFGQHSATLAGFAYVKGDIVITLDDDGQIPVDELPILLDKMKEGYDIVMGEYNESKHSGLRRLGSKINDFMAQMLINKPKDLHFTSFVIIKSFIVKEIIKYKNPYPYLPGLLLRTSNKIINVPVNHRDRTIGKSGYTFLKLLSLWMNGFTAFSVKPLHIATAIGVICAISGFIFGGFIIIHKFLHPEILIGYSSIMATLLFIGGMIMLMIGLIGEYIGRIYISINNSPQFVIRETINIDPLN